MSERILEARGARMSTYQVLLNSRAEMTDCNTGGLPEPAPLTW